MYFDLYRHRCQSALSFHRPGGSRREFLWFEISASQTSGGLCALESLVRAQIVAAHLTRTNGHLHIMVVFSNHSPLRNAHAPAHQCCQKLRRRPSCTSGCWETVHSTGFPPLVPPSSPPNLILTEFVAKSLDAAVGSRWTWCATCPVADIALQDTWPPVSQPVHSNSLLRLSFFILQSFNPGPSFVVSTEQRQHSSSEQEPFVITNLVAQALSLRSLCGGFVCLLVPQTPVLPDHPPRDPPPLDPSSPDPPLRQTPFHWDPHRWTPPPLDPPAPDPSAADPPPADRPKLRAFFPLAPPFSLFFSLSLSKSSRGILVV